MSVNSNTITIYSSPQVKHQKTGESDVTESVAEARVPKRTTYRVKISNSKDLEALSAAAKLGLTSWVGGQRVRIVGLEQKQFSECATTEKPASSSVDCENFSGSLKASVAPQQAICQNGSVTNGIYSAASGKPNLHPGYLMVSAAESNSQSCMLSSFNDSGDGQYEHFATCSPSQLCMTSSGQSTLVLNHSQPSGCLKATTDTETSSRHCRNGSLNSVMPLPRSKSTVCSSLLRGLPHRVHYLGTVAIDSHNNITANSAVEVSRRDACNGGVTDAAVISVVKRVAESMNENKLSNGKKLTVPTVGCIKNNHGHTAYKTNNQLLNQSQNSLAISARCLKRPFVEDDTTRVISAKMMALEHSVPCSTEASKFSHSTSSGTRCQDVTSNMLNCLAARPRNTAVHTDCSVNNPVKHCQSNVEVNNNCTSQQIRLSNLVPKFRLPSGSMTISYKDYKLNHATVRPHIKPHTAVALSSNSGYLSQTDSCKIVSLLDSQVCARLRPFSSTRNKSCSFTFLLSRHRVSDVRFDDNYGYNCKRRMELCDLPMAMRFRHLREFSRETVTVHRSKIHGLGLFCLRDVSAGEMLMEYAGEVIRASVADVRERRYDAQGIGCYMFRCGDDHVVDATKCGNVARFINHSCEPNCYSRQIIVDGRLHIVIFAQRDIRCGEELTYDYKFPLEAVKMPCFCNARRCRKYLN